MQNAQELQDSFLDELCKDKASVSIFLINGIKLHGVVDDYDEHVVMLKNSITQMVYKHAISTIVPARTIQTSKHNTGDKKGSVAE